MENVDGGFNDSDVPIHVVIKSIVEEASPKRYTFGNSGGSEADVDAENFENDDSFRAVGSASKIESEVSERLSKKKEH